MLATCRFDVNQMAGSARDAAQVTGSLNYFP